MSGERTSNLQSGPKKKTGWIIAAVILGLFALPVILPLAICIAGGVLAVAVALAGGGIAVLLGILGGIFVILLCLGALLLCGMIGTGCGIVLLFQTPASGLCVLGVSLLAAGGGVLGCLVAWQLAVLFVRGTKALACWIGRLCSGKKRKVQDAAAQEQKEPYAQEAVQCVKEEENREAGQEAVSVSADVQEEKSYDE